MTTTVAGISVPDTALVRAATEYIREHENDLLFDHSRRVFFFGALHGLKQGLDVDLELLYLGAIFHDLGLTEQYRDSHLRFEVDGANAAHDFMLNHNASEADARSVWLGIALHTTPGIPQFLDSEIALVTAGVETDVLGIGYHDLNDDDRKTVTDAHPRPDFKNRILNAFAEGNYHRPETTFGNVNADVLAHFMPGFERDDFVEIIRANPWAE